MSPPKPTEVAPPVDTHPPPFREYWYSTTPTLSLEAPQLTVALEAEMELNVGVPGALGADVSGVLNELLLGLLALPALSRARTCTE